MPEKKKILIVDDSQDMRAILSMRLTINGYGVIMAEDGQEALYKVKEESPHLVILDLMLPKIDGYEVCRMLKFDDKLKNIPVIVLSALDQQDEREKAVGCGADAYFIKPFDLELLLTKIRSLIL
ncbi:MAG: response regulator [Candidatus Omnitrophica bacterium]|nr:response regulator [Candidatus Omnitrophota bacterium]